MCVHIHLVQYNFIKCSFVYSLQQSRYWVVPLPEDPSCCPFITTSTFLVSPCSPLPIMNLIYSSKILSFQNVTYMESYSITLGDFCLFLKLSCLLLLSWESSLCILCRSPLVDIWIVNVFSQSVAFIFLTIFWGAEAFHFMRSNLSFCYGLCFLCSLRNLCLPQDHKVLQWFLLEVL